MAAVDPTTQVRQLYNNDGPHMLFLFRIKGISTGDTLDVSTWLSKIQQAVFIPVTSNNNGSLPSIAGTVLTFGQANLTNESGALLVLGGWA